ncbi:isochorismate synthase [Blastococcus sp. MG754426]|uniref:isochorismate synthase n=1 Tax=unclassified Blastococcus TaxID=2619396 RepID=UPI001EF0493F|nr:MULTISPECIES: isochorismate synthase [unclassified Blastococcus]MCF6510087.1 isochorismate synthase [Blastococcus sp. MG754426]MCF6514462.1 isochorismate synthase [Blastococcus sp. MG754427]MCF6737453.1 isochorismate synthase [Blastococcus sp. KM273129]
MTAAALTSPAAAADTVSTVRADAAGELLDLLPAGAGLSWVRRGEGLVGWGEAARLEVSGPGALAEAADWWDTYVAGLDVGDDVGVPGSGPVLFGSIAFDPVAGTSVFVVPEVVVGRRDGVGWVTAIGAAPELPAPVRDGDSPAPRLRYADGALDPASWCAAVAAAVERIAAGDLAKVVLARDLLVSAEPALDPRRLLHRLAARFPGCWTFAVDGLLGATPELLLRRTGRQLSSRVLAGTAPRGAGAEDERLATALLGSAKDRVEHALAVDSLVRALEPYCGELTAPGEPELLTLANVRHLATDVVGTQRVPAGLLELVGAVHPTAAVCGTPTTDAAALIGELEGMDRGRYAGPVGWMDARGDGEFGLALRCAELTADGGARLFAGCGIVAGSDPAAELAETQSKFAAFQAALES